MLGGLVLICFPAEYFSVVLTLDKLVGGGWGVVSHEFWEAWRVVRVITE